MVGPVLCPFRRCFKTPCPVCGSTRATLALVKGDIPSAFALNPMLVIIAGQAVACGALKASTGWQPSGRTLKIVGCLNGAGLVFVWLARLRNGTLPRA